MTPLFKKLNFKDQPQILVLNSPASLEPELKAMNEVTKVITNAKAMGRIGFVLVFVYSKKEIDEQIRKLYPKLDADAVLWFCYPKGTSKKYTCDFNRDNGWDALEKYKFESVRMVAIDDDWSALRFRKQELVKKTAR